MSDHNNFSQNAQNSIKNLPWKSKPKIRTSGNEIYIQ